MRVRVRHHIPPGFSGDLELGGAVMGVTWLPCGTCERCLRGQEVVCDAASFEPDDPPAAAVFPKPDDLSYEEAALLGKVACSVYALSFGGRSLAVLGEDGLFHRLAPEYGLELAEPADLVVVLDGRYARAQEIVAKGGTILICDDSPGDIEFDTTRLHYDQIAVHSCRRYRRQDLRKAVGHLVNRAIF